MSQKMSSVPAIPQGWNAIEAEVSPAVGSVPQHYKYELASERRSYLTCKTKDVRNDGSPYKVHS